MPSVTREKLKNNIKMAYLEAKRPESPKVKAELELNVKNHHSILRQLDCHMRKRVNYAALLMIYKKGDTSI